MSRVLPVIADAHDGTVEAVPLPLGVTFRFRMPETAADQFADEQVAAPGRAGTAGDD